ncbi:MAG: polyhydroxyalkanoic acid system family protein [Pseudomonadota bacterium]
MSGIDIKKQHTLDLEQAQQIADNLAGDLAKKFAVVYHWDGDVLSFERAGVNGDITVNQDVVHVRAELGFLLSYLKPAIEHEINRYLDEHYT